MSQIWIGIGSVLGAIGVMMGAFGAHALAARLSPRMLEVYQTGAQYHMIHSLALVAVGLWISYTGGKAPYSTAAAVAFLIGILVFSGSLYTLAITEIKILGAITPLGGVAFIVGWICLAISAFRGVSS